MKTQVVAALLLLGFALLDTDHAFANATLGQIGKSVGKGILKSAPGWALRNDREDSEDQDVRQRSEGYPRNYPNRFPHDGRSDAPYSYESGTLRRELKEFERARYCSGYADYVNCGW